MKYDYKSQEKALKYLIENTPHDIEKFQKLYNVETQKNIKPKISLNNILFSNIWSTEEKVNLIKLYGYNKEKNSDPSPHHWTYKSYEMDIGYSVGIEGLPLIDQCIKNKNFSGVEALLILENHISVATIHRIIEYIDDPSERYKFCELIVNHYKNQDNIKAYKGTGNQCYLREIPSLCDRYPEYIGIFNDIFLGIISSMECICATNDLELVKLFLPTVKNIKPLFMFAVKSKNIEMVKLFIELGADVNFQDLEYEKDSNRRIFRTPIKIAIDNNDLNMVKFLHENGADLNYVDNSEKMQEFITNLGKEKETHEYKDYWDRHDYIIWAKTPLEYAINLGKASIINQDLINNNSTRKNDSIEKQFKDRINIVKYLYENGATFSNSKMNYTDLICFAIKSDDFDTTKYYFEEAKKHNFKLNFAKIISFIHEPGVYKHDKYSSTCYKIFKEDASYWFNLCEEYSNKIDHENYNKNLKLMIKKIFYEFNYDSFKDVIYNFSKKLCKNELKDIPAVLKVDFKNLEEILDLGYDINCIDKNGNNIIMDYIINRNLDVATLEKLVSLGANINYQNFSSGENPLSCVISKLPKYDFEKFIYNFNIDTKKLYQSPEEYEKEKKFLVNRIIELTNIDIIASDSVKQSVYYSLAPGYPQIIYNEILEVLSKKGFKVDDEYVTNSITFLDKSYSKQYITNPWQYLWNLYNNFTNKSIDTHFSFPNIQDAKNIKFGTKEANHLFMLISEHLKRNFVTLIDQIERPNDIARERWDSLTCTYYEENYLQLNQRILLDEIKKYISYIDYRQIISLLDDISILDINAINRSDLLSVALDKKDKKLCEELINRGATIVCCVDGHDMTDELYTTEQIELFKSINKQYNPDYECENLLSEIGCGNKILSLKKIHE